MQPATIATTAVNSSLLGGHPRRGFPPSSPPTRLNHLVAAGTRRGHPGRIYCEAAVSTADVSSSAADASSSSGVDRDAEAASRVGARVRVKGSVKVYHVQKVPELELEGMEGVVKQYAGLWKGKRVSANLPFKVQFVLPDGVEGRPGPLKFLAHLREDELEFLPQD